MILLSKDGWKLLYLNVFKFLYIFFFGGVVMVVEGHSFSLSGKMKF